jgi:hypothetical protein
MTSDDSPTLSGANCWGQGAMPMLLFSGARSCGVVNGGSSSQMYTPICDIYKHIICDIGFT